MIKTNSPDGVCEHAIFKRINDCALAHLQIDRKIIRLSMKIEGGQKELDIFYRDIEVSFGIDLQGRKFEHFGELVEYIFVVLKSKQ